MFRTLSDDEVKAANDRRVFLYGSPFTLDNLTAILMDTDKGEFGLHEHIARAKAHGVITWLTTIAGVDIPERLRRTSRNLRGRPASAADEGDK